MKPFVLDHVTLNTGHLSKVPSSIVKPETERLLSPIIKNLGGNLPGLGAAFRVEIHYYDDHDCEFTFYRGREPLTFSMLIASKDESENGWKLIEKLYLDLSDSMPEIMAAGSAPVKPESFPWLGTVILPPFVMMPRESAGFIGHMETCFGIIMAEGGVE